MACMPPSDLVVYRTTPEYTEETIPAGLRRRHSTRAEVWARIRVIEGRLRLRRLEPAEECVLTPETPGIVAPEAPHEVAPLGRVRFVVDFLRSP